MSPHPTRRHFLKTAALAPLAAWVGLPAASAAFEPVKRAGGPHFKTSLNAYSFFEVLNANLKDKS